MGNMRWIGKALGALALGSALSGCMSSGEGGVGVTLNAFNFMSPAEDPQPQSVLSPQMENGTESEIIAGLLNRRSILPEGPYAEVANAVLDANSRAAEADLRAARLRAEAASSPSPVFLMPCAM